MLDSSERLLNNSNEYQTCDKYLRWGEKKYKKDIELFNIKTLKQKRYSQNSNILILHRTAGHEVEPYSRLDEFRVYNNCLVSLLESFTNDNKKKTTIRLKRTFKWTNPKEMSYLNQKFPSIKIEDGTKNFYSNLKK